MTEEIDKYLLRKYEVAQKLGKGAYGIVWKAYDKKSKDTVALKKIFDAFQNATDAQRTYREVVFLSQMYVARRDSKPPPRLPRPPPARGTRSHRAASCIFARPPVAQPSLTGSLVAARALAGATTRTS